MSIGIYDFLYNIMIYFIYTPLDFWAILPVY